MVCLGNMCVDTLNKGDNNDDDNNNNNKIVRSNRSKDVSNRDITATKAFKTRTTHSDRTFL